MLMLTFLYTILAGLVLTGVWPKYLADEKAFHKKKSIFVASEDLVAGKTARSILRKSKMISPL